MFVASHLESLPCALANLHFSEKIRVRVLIAGGDVVPWGFLLLGALCLGLGIWTQVVLLGVDVTLSLDGCLDSCWLLLHLVRLCTR